MNADLIFPDWPVPEAVGALVTTRRGGVSKGPYAGFNLGAHVDDDASAVAANRAALRAWLPADPVWLTQVHGTAVVQADAVAAGAIADAAVTRVPGVVCAVLTADCLPVLLCDDEARVVGIAHAGWRGLAAGVIETTAAAMHLPGERLLAWLGPAVGAASFEVGDEVRRAFTAHDAGAAAAFRPAARTGKWYADLYELARQRLNAIGVTRVSGGGFDTCAEAGRFYSYRREPRTGRMASLVWIRT